jgi:ribosome recycling factor
MPADDILLDCEEQMDKAVEHLKHELRSIRTGRANPAMVESVKVDYYGSPTDLKSIASINVPEATQILIKPFSPGDLKAIERAINDAKLPMTPHSDGRMLRLTLPPMSQDVRLRMAAQVKGMGEDVKVRIRNARREANKLVDSEQKGSVMTEDEANGVKEQVQELTKTYETKVDDMLEHKRQEVMTV